MTEIIIGIEIERANHWAYEVQVIDAGVICDYQVTLSWPDYDLWSRGRVAPEKVIDAIFKFMLHREKATDLLSKFDCALVRRLFPEVDQILPTMI